MALLALASEPSPRHLPIHPFYKYSTKDSHYTWCGLWKLTKTEMWPFLYNSNRSLWIENVTIIFDKQELPLITHLLLRKHWNLPHFTCEKLWKVQQLAQVLCAYISRWKKKKKKSQDENLGSLPRMHCHLSSSTLPPDPPYQKERGIHQSSCGTNISLPVLVSSSAKW